MINGSLKNTPTLQLSLYLPTHWLSFSLTLPDSPPPPPIDIPSKSGTHLSSKSKIATYQMKVGDRKYRESGSELNNIGWRWYNMRPRKEEHLEKAII